MRTVLTLVVMLACGLGYAAEADFPEEPLKTPVVVGYTSDKCKPLVLRLDAPARTLRLEFSRGGGTPYFARANDNLTLRNHTDPETGEPDPERQEFTDFMAGTQIAAWCRAQPDAVTNREVLRKLCLWLLQKKGIIE